MIRPDRTACAAGILRCGQERSEARSLATGELRDEPAAQKTAALRVALGGSPDVVTNLGRSSATPFGPFLAGEPPSATQAVLSDRIMV